jgi:hypothetical protein
MAHGASILEFMNTHCSQDGATYWLYRDGASGDLQVYEVDAELQAAAPVRRPLRPWWPAGFDCDLPVRRLFLSRKY